ncbi:MAG: UDP-N-acetylglucosamine 1-carboxyvinyltransferase [Bdellovibrionales bacterium]|nr:UDP-N-acetylglucosamine 1-carboxyvinyltransferase [Bdellovibrionales bacterium]
MSVVGGKVLNGEVTTGGAKNSVLALVFAALLAPGRHRLSNVPRLNDIESANLLLNSLGCETQLTGNVLEINVPEKLKTHADYDIVRKMRASILCLGPLLARMREAQVSLPGGCAIGARPINLHLEAMKSLDAEMKLENGYVIAKTKKLKGAKITFELPTVGGTENAMMAATLADGETIIENAAKEPEINDLAEYLRKMGAKIEGDGTSLIKIQGVDQLKATDHAVIPDRVEAGTLIIAAAITHGQVTVKNCNPKHLESFLHKLQESGVKMELGKDSVTVLKSHGYKGVDMATGPYPGYPTDLQAQFMTLMTEADGISVIKETVFENRFMHVQELNRLAADITISSNTAIIHGKPGSLIGAQVMATDLRASACLILAGLAAKGETIVGRIYHLDRGYENLEGKLLALGAQIKRLK